MGNLSFENVLALIISLGESDSEFSWDFDAGNDDSEFSNKLWKLNSFVLFCHRRWVCKYFAERFE
jgi:hypothetical protein